MAKKKQKKQEKVPAQYSVPAIQLICLLLKYLMMISEMELLI